MTSPKATIPWLLGILVLVSGAQDKCTETNLWDSLGRVWLERDRELPSMRAKSIVGEFCSDSPITVQLWMKSGSFSYKLVWQKLIFSPSGRGRQVFPLSPSEYVDLTSKHRLALFSSDKERPLAVPAAFNSSYGGQLVDIWEMGPYKLKETYEFNDLGLPRRFLLEFCDTPECPLPTTTVTSTQLPPTTPRINVPSQFSCRKTLVSPGKALLEQQRSTPNQEGLIKALGGHFCNGSVFQVQVWEPVDDVTRTYRLVWNKRVAAPSTDGSWTVLPLLFNERFTMSKFYRTAVYVPQEGAAVPVPVSFRPMASTMVQARFNGGYTKCKTAEFEDLGFPNEFSLHFCLDIACETLKYNTFSPRPQRAPPMCPNLTDGVTKNAENTTKKPIILNTVPNEIEETPAGKPPIVRAGQSKSGSRKLGNLSVVGLVGTALVVSQWLQT